MHPDVLLKSSSAVVTGPMLLVTALARSGTNLGFLAGCLKDALGVRRVDWEYIRPATFKPREDGSEEGAVRSIPSRLSFRTGGDQQSSKWSLKQKRT